MSARTKWLSDRMTLLLVLLNATWLLEAAMAAFWGAMALLTDLEDELSVMDTMDEDGLLDGACVNSGELSST